MKNYILGAVLLLAGVSQARAQVNTPHVYVGGAAQLPMSVDAYTVGKMRPALTIGLALSQRWALELDPLLYWSQSQIFNSYTQNGNDYIYRADYRSWTLALPLLARFTLSEPGKRWKVDALGGITWLHGWGSSSSSSTTNGQLTYGSDYQYSSNAASLILGPQLRCALNSKLTAKLNAPINYGLTGSGSFTQRLYLTPQLGMQYTFAR